MKARSGGTALSTLAGDRPVIRRDRAVLIRAVDCPTCKAPADYPCVSSTGKAAVHGSRRRMAIRAENASYALADVTYARRLPTYSRRGLREAAGHSRDDLAGLLGVTSSLVGRYERGEAVPTGPEGAAYGIWLRSRIDAQVEPVEG